MVRRRDREEIIDQRGACVWLSGLPASGKTTLARALTDRLHSQGFLCFELDADDVRDGLSSGLGFSLDERAENLRRAAHAARLLVDSGVIVIAAFITPTETSREEITSILGDSDFALVYVDCPLGICKKRDPKGLYARADAAELDDMTGVDSPYEEPAKPGIAVRTDRETPRACVDAIYSYMVSRGFLERPSTAPDA